ncbi:glycosyltransferase [Paenibacillus sp. GCM10023252]|uniref:glycosyltransferase n=1 Tax=Paenibacillus sp. GCM10023252 TaxID=3252649 RepID=UPI003619E112
METLISLCMIVKDEQEVLGRCLESVKDLVDEIIIVDTGSSDQTIEIALTYTSKVYTFKWIDDFAAARNESIKYATGKWILILDADEFILKEDHDDLRIFLLQQTNTHPTLYSVRVINYLGAGQDTSQIMDSSAARIFPNYKGLYYEGSLHEQLTAGTVPVRYLSYPLSVHHDGYIETTVIKKQKTERNLSILEKNKQQLMMNEAYYNFILGNEYKKMDSSIAMAINMYSRSLSMTKDTDSWYHHLLISYITLEMKVENYEAAYQLLLDAIQLNPNISEYYCMLGILYNQFSLWNQACSSFENAIRIANEANNSKVPHWKVYSMYGTVVPNQMLGYVALARNDRKLAIEKWINVLKLQPKNFTLLSKMFEQLIHNYTTLEVIHLFNLLYKNAGIIEYNILFNLSLKTGHKELADYYGNILINLRYVFNNQEMIMYHLLFKRTHDMNRFEISTLSPEVGFVAALVYNEQQYLEQISHDIEGTMELWTYVHHSNQYSSNSLSEQTANILLPKVLVLLLTWNYEDLYYNLLQSVADQRTVNKLAHLLHTRGYSQLSMPLYSMLIDNGVVDLDGIKNVGVWQLQQNEVELGLILIDEYISSVSSYDALGAVRHYCSDDQYQILHTKFLALYPEASNYTFLK